MNLLQPLSGVVPTSLSWLWPKRLALGKLTIFDGDPDVGKSLVTLDLAARLTTGRPFPGCESAAPPGNVIILHGEDAVEDTLVPRLQAIARNKADQRIFVRGDKAINYGRVMEVMGLVAAAGFDKVALIAEMPQSAAPAAAARGTQPPRRTN